MKELLKLSFCFSVPLLNMPHLVLTVPARRTGAQFFTIQPHKCRDEWMKNEEMIPRPKAPWERVCDIEIDGNVGALGQIVVLYIEARGS